MSDFKLHPTLERDTHLIADLPLSRLLLMNDARYPWVILVPRLAGLTELYQLDAKARQQLTSELDLVSTVLCEQPTVAKLNVANLGNLVPQLHVHVVGRQPQDPAWPGPVWGHSPAAPYATVQLATQLAALRVRLQALTVAEE